MMRFGDLYRQQNQSLYPLSMYRVKWWYMYHDFEGITHVNESSRYASGPIVADPGSASGATFQCMQFLPFLSIFSYLGHTSLLGLQTKTRR